MNAPAPEGATPTFRLAYSPPAVLRTTIPIAATPASGEELLVDGKGAPVWPYADEEERALLTGVAQLFGAEAAEVPAVHASTAVHDDRAETVVGVGDTGDVATLYAHLTGRRPIHVGDFEELVGGDLPAVVVICSPQLDRRLIQALALAGSADEVTGIIWGKNRRQLHLQALKASCAATANGPLKSEHIHLVGPDLGASSKGLSVDALKKLLAEGSGVLSILSHSDGTSQAVDRTAVLCPRATDEDRDMDRGPECLYTGHCFVLGMPVEKAVEERRIIGPGEVAARLFVNFGCHSAFLGNLGVDAAWSTLPGLIANPRIGAVVATPNIGTYFAGPMSQELLRSLHQGMQVGKALAKFEENPIVQQFGYRMVLFGDPRVRAQPAAGGVIRRDATGGLKPPVPLDLGEADQGSGLLPRLEFVRRVALYLRAETRQEGSRTSRIVVERIKELEEAPDAEAALVGPPGRALRRALLEHLANAKARLWEVWQLGGHVCRLSDEVGRCPECGWRVRAHLVQLPGGLRREHVRCPVCSDVLDLDVACETRPTACLPEIRLEGPRSTSGWDGALYFVRRRATETRFSLWPAQPDGSPVPRLDVLDHLPPEREQDRGLTRVYATFIDGLAMQSSCGLMRMGAHGPEFADRPRLGDEP